MGLRLQDIERLHVVLLVALVCAAYATGWLAPRSVLLGGAVMGGNFWLMRQLATRLITPSGWPVIVLGLMLVKFTLFLALLGALFWRLPIDPLAFGIGATALLVACVVTALRAAPTPALS